MVGSVKEGARSGGHVRIRRGRHEIWQPLPYASRRTCGSDIWCSCWPRPTFCVPCIEERCSPWILPPLLNCSIWFRVGRALKVGGQGGGCCTQDHTGPGCEVIKVLLKSRCRRIRLWRGSLTMSFCLLRACRMQAGMTLTSVGYYS
jgi:hypothetical protein